MNEHLESDQSSTQQPLRCTAYCEATSFEISKLVTYLRKKEVDYTEYRKGAGVIHQKYGLNNGDVFYFPYGTVVMWGLSQSEEKNITASLKAFEKEPVSMGDFEFYLYTMGETAKVARGTISLPSRDILTRLAVSHGLAQSVKLGTFEKRIEGRITDSKYIAESLASKGRIPLNRRSITKMQGNVFIDRSLVNLHSDVLDTPEFFWEYSELEPLYTMIANDLDIKSRVSVLNKRMDILKDLFDMLGDELNTRHSSFLELTIVVLIMAEIIIVLIKEFFNFG